MNEIIQKLSVMVLPLIFAITVHEASHGWVASKLGDQTARKMGRLTFNPIPHIDPIGTILVPMLMFVSGGFLFGWAKPVPVNMRSFQDPRKGMAIVAIAGPLSNLFMAMLWAIVWKVGLILLPSNQVIAVPLLLMAHTGVFLNIVLMVLNLLPLPPLDGGRVLTWLLPSSLAEKVDHVEPYGIFILIGLLFFGLWRIIIAPATVFFIALIEQIFGTQFRI